MRSFSKKQLLRRFRKVFTSGSSSSRKNRISQFERLEQRRVLAAAIWHNARFPVDVSNNQPAMVSPLDILLIINHLNDDHRTGTFGRLLPRQVDEPSPRSLVDVSCDGRVTPLDILLVINYLNQHGSGTGGGFSTEGGLYVNAACSPQLLEGDHFVDQMTQVLRVPADKAALRVTFQSPVFDTASRGQIRDAFEIEITDAAGERLALPYQAGREAIYNWTEALEPLYAAGTWTTTGAAGETSSFTIDLSRLPASTEVHVSVRLVNNDSDNNTSVNIRGFEFVSVPEGGPSTPLRTAASEVSEVSPFDFNQLSDLTGSVSADYGRTSLRGDNNELFSEFRLTNIGSQAVVGPLIVVLENFTELDAFAIRPDGILPDGRPFYDLSSRLDEGILRAGETVRSRELRFLNNSGNRFAYQLKAYGKLNSAPVGFASSPLTSIEAERTYRYTALATDAEQQTLTYSVVGGPDSMTIDTATGMVQWVTTQEHIGAHRIVLRATDPHGLYVEQTFVLEVVESLQNRPPLFVSDPVTDAIASSGFEITTVATGAQPAGVDVISGFRGPRLVSINAGDQTVSVHAGQKNDRFDGLSTLSIGQPKLTTSTYFDVGYSVDVGLTPWSKVGDTNEINGLDQGDFNGDGILDLAVLTHQYDNVTRVRRYEIVRMLGDGDGQFGEPEVLGAFGQPAGTIPRARNLVISDINGDGHLDLLATETRYKQLFFIPGNGDGSFGEMVTTTLDYSISDFRVVDLDQNGTQDLVGRKSNVSSFGANHELAWWSGNGDGTFGDVQIIDTAGSGSIDNQERPYDIADLNGDGLLDIVSNDDRDLPVTPSNGQTIRIYLANAPGSFNAAIIIDPPGPAFFYDSDWMRIADFTGDGHYDIAFMHVWHSTLELLVGDGSGVNFVQRTALDNIQPRSDNYAGSGDVVDIDGDGDLDLVLTNPFSPNASSSSPQVLVNDGNGNFTRTEYGIVDFPGQVSLANEENRSFAAGAMFADYNRDGIIDIAYMTQGRDFNGVGIRLGTRPGEFGSSRSIPLFDDPIDNEVHPGDYNGDGIIDLLSLRSTQMFLGNGDGTFANPFPAYSVARANNFGSTADFNLDGLTDIVATRGNQGGSRYYVALSNGDGTLSVSDDKAVESSFYGYSATKIADFNGDGYPDFIAKASVERHVDVHLNNPEAPGTFTRTFRITTVANGINVSNFDYSFGTGDFNGDGIIDITYGDQVGTEPTKIVILAGDGQGGFSQLSDSFVFDDDFLTMNFYYPGDLAVGDVDEDGALDIVSFTSVGPRVIFGNGEGSFRPRVDHYYIDTQGVIGRGLENYLIDFDEDGHLDMVEVAGQRYGVIRIRPGDGTGLFGEPRSVDIVQGGQMLAFADLDHDGHLDIVHVGLHAGGVSVDLPDALVYAGIRDGLVDLLTLDLNGDGNEEVLTVYENSDRLTIFTGDNLDQLTRQPDLLTGRAPKAVAVADLNDDGQFELITANRASRSLSVFTGSVTEGYTSAGYAVGRGPVDIETADLNNDGKVDLVVVDDSLQALWVYTGNGTTTLATPIAIALGDTPGRLSIADVSGDGHLDAVVTLPKSNRLMILPGDGAIGFSAPVYVALTSSPSDLQVVDLNDDGHADLVATLPDSDVLSVLYGRGNNQFAKAQQIQVGQYPTRVTLADADQDGRVDLIVSNRGDDTVSVIYNRFDPNEVYRYDSDAIDPDDDTITYTVVDGPGGLIINSQAGQLLWAASPDQVGEHAVTIAADDGRGGIATQTFKIDVQLARENAAPLIATQPPTTIGANEAFNYQVTALDNDHHTLRYSLIDGPEGSTIDRTTGQVHWDARNEAVQLGLLGQTSNVEVPADDSYKSSSVTLEGWYNLHTLTASNGGAVFFRQPGQFGSAFYLRSLFNTQLQLIMNYEGQQLDFRVPFTSQTDRWYHVALTIDGDTRTASLLVDGAVLGQRDLPGPIPYSPSGRLQIGDTSPFYTRASIDNFRVWNYARSAEEIQAGLGQQYDDEPSLVLDYRFDGPEMRSIRDYSIYNNHGFKVANPQPPILVRGLAMAGLFNFTVGVEDGRGGADSQSFTVEVLPELRGTIRGQAFSDLDSSGTRNESEPVLTGVHLFIDTNGNGFLDPSELQTTTDTSGNYQFGGLLPGQYAIRVSPLAGYESPTLGNTSVTANANSAVDLALEQLAHGQIRGQLRTEQADRIAYWKVFADLDLDNERDEDEPMAMSDRDGNFAITGLNAGSYTIRAELPAGWTVADGTNGQNVTLAADAISEGNHFTLEPTNTSVTGGLHFVTMPTLAIEARQTFRYASVAIGIHSEAIHYDLSLAPEGMSIDSATGLIAWRPSIAQVGEQLVIVRATGASGSIALHDFTLNVAAPNAAPTLTTELPGTAYVGLVYAVNLEGQDAESQAITYHLMSGPSTATLNATTGELRWTPTLADVGNVAFSIELRDSTGGVSSVNATVEVVNSQPAATPFSVTLPRTQVGLGQDYFARVQGTDALGRPLTWSLVTGPSGLLVSPNGTLTWTPGNDDLGSHSIVLQATNVAGATANSTFTLQAVGRPVNSAPSVTSTPLTSTTLGQKYHYTVDALDSDADPLSFALVNAPVGMSIHPSLGTIRWTPAADQLGESDVSIEVTDPDGATATQEFKLKVSKSGGPPAITSIPPTEASVGSGYLYSLLARDAEGDPLTFRLLAAPAGMTIAATTGVISWTPQAGQVGQQDVVIEVSDGVGGAATQAFAIRVSSGVANLPPVISSSAPRFGTVGTAYSYSLQASDPESTAIVYSLGQAPASMTINASSGAVAWTPTAGQAGKFVVTLIATDAGGASAVESFELDVLAANSPPTIASTAPIASPAGAVFSYQVLGRDVDLDQLTYQLTTAPAGATIDSFGKISWPTTPALIGPHNFVVRVSDPRGGVATQSFTLNVIEDLEAPKLSIIENLGDANRNILPWQGPFVVYVRAIDNVAVRSLTLKANGQDIPLDAAGTATFTFEDWRFQTINATATAVDTNGNITSKTITFDYDFPEGWGGAGTEDIPTVAITSPTDTAAVFGMVTIMGTASHEDFAGYKLSYRRIDETTFTEFQESTTAVVNGELGVWDTSLLINDEYVIRLEAASNAGVVNVVEHHVGLSGELKLGNFRLSFTDMVIPVAGIPIEITRIYDTLQADREGDFGYGWRLEYRNTDLRVGLPKSGLEDIGIYSPLRPGVKVYLNVPGQGRQGFTFNPEIRVLPGFGGNNLVLGRPRFKPDRGVTSTLSTGTSGYLQVNERGELFAPGGIPYNPASPDFGGSYVLTTREGVVYRIDGSNGKLDSARDRNHNFLTYTEDGIKQSDPNGNSTLEVTIVRNTSGQITSIRNPSGKSTRYEYSSGNLAASQDELGNETQYVYAADGSNRLLTVVDALGRTGVRTEYDSDGRTSAITGADGARILLGYNTASLIQTVTDQLGNVSIVGFDRDGNSVFEQDALGNAIRSTFDSNARLKSSSDKLGNTTHFVHNTFGDLISRTDPLGKVVRFEHNPQGDVVSTVNSQGQRSFSRRDAAGNIVNIIDESGLKTDIQYDFRGNATHFSGVTNRSDLRYNAFGFVSQQEDSRGSLYNSEFDPLGRVTRTVAQLSDGRLASSSREYDAAGRLVMQTDAMGGRKEYTYDAVGQMVSMKDALGNETRFEYDLQGRLTKAIFADATPLNSTDNPFVETRYDAAGRVVETIDELSRSTKFLYDAIGNVLEEIYADGTVGNDTDNPRRKFEYDANGRVLASIDELGRRTEYTYDAVGNRLTFRTTDRQIWSFAYDSLGRRESQLDPRGNRNRFNYDAAGKLIGQTFPDDSVVSLQVDAANRVATSIERDGSTTISEFSEDSQLIRSVDQESAEWKFSYDSFGNLEAITNSLGNRTFYAFDLLGRKVASTKPSGVSSSMRYDLVGNLVELTDYNGQLSQYRYDARNRLIESTYHDGSSTRYEYDLVGNRTTIIGEDGRTEFRYDERNRLVRQTNPDLTSIAYEYDAFGNRTGLLTSFGNTRYQFNSLNQIESVIAPDGGLTQYQYDSVGLLVKTIFANGLVETRAHDSLGKVQTIETMRGATSISRWEYAYNLLGQRVSITGLDGSNVKYAYDRTGRLISESSYSSGPNTTNLLEYGYDSVGNRVRKLVNGVEAIRNEHNVNDQLIRSESNGNITTYRYDLNGNLIAESVNGVLKRAFAYDVRDRLVAIDADANGAFEIQYSYDELGNRVSKSVSGDTTRFLVDSLRINAEVLAEYDGSTNSHSQFYVYGNGILSQSHGSSVSYYHSDAIGSVRVVTNAQGGITNTYDYTAFGELSGNVVTIDNEYMFAGQRRDSESGLDYLRARYMSSALGRFIGQDAFPPQTQRLASLNAYAYANGNPTSFVDPSGFASVGEQTVVQTIIQGLVKGTGILKAAKGAKQRAEIAQQVVFLVYAGVHAYVFNLFDTIVGGYAPGVVTAETTIGFEHEINSDIWVKKVKLTQNVLKDEREYEFGLGKLGENTEPSVSVKFCGGVWCGGKVGVSHVFVQIPEAKGDESNEFNGAFLAIALKAEASFGIESKKHVGDVSLNIEAVAFGTLKYTITLFSAAKLAQRV